MKKILLTILLFAGVSFSQVDTIKVPGYTTWEDVYNALNRGVGSFQLVDTNAVNGFYRRGYIDALMNLKQNVIINIGDTVKYVEYTDSASSIGWYRRAYMDALLSGKVNTTDLNGLIYQYLVDSSETSSYTIAQIDSLLGLAGTASQPSDFATINGYDITSGGNITITGTASPDGWDYPENYGGTDIQKMDSLFGDYGIASRYQDSLFIKFKPNETYYWGAENDSSTMGGVFVKTLSQGLKYLYLDGQGATINCKESALGAFFAFGGWGTDYTNVGNTGYADSVYSIPNAYLQGSLKVKVPTDISSKAKYNDVLWITNEADYFGAIDREPPWLTNGSSNGELVKVLSVSNDTLTLMTPLREYYPAGDTTKIALYDFPTIIIKNLNIVADIEYYPSDYAGNEPADTLLRGTAFGQTGITIQCAKDVLIENVTISGTSFAGITLQDCIDATLTNVRVYDFSTHPSLGNNYGVMLFGGGNYIVDNCNIQGGRHAIDISVTSMPTRNVIISNSIFANEATNGSATISTHPGCRDINIIGNVVYGPIGLRNCYNNIENNIILSPGSGYSTGIGIGNSWYIGDDNYNNIIGNSITGPSGRISLTVSNNTANGQLHTNMLVENNSLVTDQFFLLEHNVDSDDTSYVDNLILKNNHWKQNDSTEYISDLVAVHFKTPYDYTKIKNFVLDGNILEVSTTTIPSYGMYLFDGANGMWDFDKMIIRNNIFDGFGNMIRTEEGYGADYIEVTNNIIDNKNIGYATYNTIWFRDTLTAVTKVLGNTFMNMGSIGGWNHVSLRGVKTYYGQSIFENSTGIGNDIVADFEYTFDWADTLVYNWGLMDTTIVGDIAGWKVPCDIIVLEVSGYTDANTCTFNIEERAETTPNTAGVDICTADVVADNNQEETTSFANDIISKDSYIVPTISATGDVEIFSISLRYIKLVR